MLLRLVTAFVFSTTALTALANDHAHSHHQQKVEAPTVSGAWSRAMPPSAPTGAVYFTLNNPGDQPERLIGAQTARAGKTELHTHVHEGDIMRMQQIDSVEIPAGGDAEFKPGGNHVMLFKLNEPLTAGEHFPLTLIFEHAGEVIVDVVIQDNPPQAAGDAHSHHQH
ncbi:MAG: copper chaperone PCu(A)C [Pseudomonas stutzeri]|uniref:copper chaperone PCu(A)C n=1 Tax=Stutzerimonas stutzeri TaxID=316 RepID=UPI002109E074|nr:copper chaperone PCu(A)C [Stutzerimonas stutzeri]MBF6624545.1 copper chaperone PCu(A)C [Stutzerimonas stutzeri]MCQ4240597.1 copper chaperone PCu(A)C [Stutzerimonas stutzeri]